MAPFAIYLKNHNPDKRTEAVRYLDRPHAKEHWLELTAVTDAHYHEMPLVSLGTQPFSWKLLLEAVDADIVYARGRHLAYLSSEGETL
ncbi:hypothetical protein FACS1894184_02380 [Clostridia bacterium]|nr:hypothetical protein FACS1894184_02380 [Clostridia bacterium]